MEIGFFMPLILVHIQLLQSHCGDNREGTLFSLYINIYIYLYVYIYKYIYINIYIINIYIYIYRLYIYIHRQQLLKGTGNTKNL